jgi:hypothetical protein
MRVVIFTVVLVVIVVLLAEEATYESIELKFEYKGSRLSGSVRLVGCCPWWRNKQKRWIS